MIIARIEDGARYYALHPLLKPLFEYVKANDLLTAPAGRVTLQGDDLFINVNDSTLVPREEQKLEVHRRYIDVHFPLSCAEDFGWRHLYGHVHTGFEWNMTEHQKRLMQDLYVRKDVCRMINAGAMLPYMAYTPRTLEELEETGLL